MGTRLFPITLEIPKVLLPVGSTTLLKHQVETSLRVSEIDQIVVVTGYKSHLVEAYLAKHFGDKGNITTVFNSHFEINNPIYSIECAMPGTPNDDFLLTNGDVYYPPSLLRQIVSQGEGVTMVISPYRDQTNRAMSVHFSQDRMVAIYPHAPERDSYESPGIVVVKGSEARNAFYHATKRLYKRYLGEPHFWHDILNEVKLEIPIKTLRVNDEMWGEVDDREDLESLERLSRNLYDD